MTSTSAETEDFSEEMNQICTFGANKEMNVCMEFLFYFRYKFKKKLLLKAYETFFHWCLIIP